MVEMCPHEGSGRGIWGGGGGEKDLSQRQTAIPNDARR
jgi:hypothetical protein